MKARIYLKSGAIVDTDVEAITTNTRGNDLTSIEWTRAEKGWRLLHIDPADVSAITVQK